MNYSEGLRSIRRRNGFHAVIVLTILFMEKKSWWKFPWKVIRKLVLQAIYHCEIHTESFSEEAICTLRLPHPYNIIIHGNSRIGKDCTIFQNCTLGVIEERGTFAPQLSDNVYIGCNSVILGGVKISDNVKIGAMGLVLRDVDKDKTVVGLVK